MFMITPEPWTFHRDGDRPPRDDDRWILVFGSNLAGRHGAGAALLAQTEFGAEPGVGQGVRGRSYAIPTKGYRLEVLPLTEIAIAVGEFVEFARLRPDLQFFVTRVGCGLAGYRNEQIAPMFAHAPDNCSFARQWEGLIRVERREQFRAEPARGG
jgi:hypothetical protein